MPVCCCQSSIWVRGGDRKYDPGTDESVSFQAARQLPGHQQVVRHRDEQLVDWLPTFVMRDQQFRRAVQHGQALQVLITKPRSKFVVIGASVQKQVAVGHRDHGFAIAHQGEG